MERGSDDLAHVFRAAGHGAVDEPGLDELDGMTDVVRTRRTRRADRIAAAMHLEQRANRDRGRAGHASEDGERIDAADLTAVEKLACAPHRVAQTSVWCLGWNSHLSDDEAPSQRLAQTVCDVML